MKIRSLLLLAAALMATAPAFAQAPPAFAQAPPAFAQAPPAFAQAPPAAPSEPPPPRPVEKLAPVVPAPAPIAPAPAPASPLPDTAEAEKAVRAAEAEAPADTRRAAACKVHALARLQAGAPSISDIVIDMDGLTIAKADLMVGAQHITAVLMGEASIQRDRADKAHRFICLVGDGDEVVMTFFTER